MANNSGKPGTKRLVDMGTYPEAEVYRPPGCPPAEEFPFPAELAPGHTLYYRPRIYRGKVVDFALQQLLETEDGQQVEIARIDCCRGTVHRHQFNQDGEDVYDHRLITAIPPRDGWDVVNRAYSEAVDVMLAEWERNVERWRDGARHA